MPSFLEQFRVLRYDTRGHGQSGVPSGPYSMAQLGGDVIALLDHAGIKKAHFCGLSMGGMTGLWVAANFPARIERLVACGAGARNGTPETWAARIETVTREGMAGIIPSVIDRWLTRDFQAHVPQRAQMVRDMLAKAPPLGYVACCAAIRDADLRDALSAITAPTLVIAAMRDKSVTPLECKQVSDRIRGARYTELKAAHLSNWEVPQAFADKVTAFLRG
jgi:3-oxoadipate enol-lactonase